MGGRAFAHLSPPLPTPRLSPPLYQALTAQYTEALLSIFGRVTVPPTRPGATSHGDIDILVAQPLVDHPLAASLSALRACITVPKTNVLATSFHLSVAVPHPEEHGSVVQVDLKTVEVGTGGSADLFDWEVLMAAHGDFWPLVGASLSKVGVVVGVKGLVLRSPEIELVEKRRSGIVLSTAVAEVLEVLGLNRAIEPFATEEEMWRLIVKMSWFLAPPYLEADAEELHGAAARRRAKRREGWCNFASWLKREIEEGRMVCESSNEEQRVEQRRKMRETLLLRFGKQVEYEEMVSSWKREQEERQTKQEAMARKREQRKHEEEYADAWTEALG